MTRTDPFILPSQIKGASYQLPGDFERSYYKNKPYVYDEFGNRRLYTRYTTFIDCLGDRTMLEKWKNRMVLTGLVVDHHWFSNNGNDVSLFDTLIDTDLDDRDLMNERVDEAFTAGDGYLKAQQGTDMHVITEKWDRLETLPPMGDWQWRDFGAWLQLIEDHNLIAVDIERKSVHDQLKAAGTPDRTYWWQGELVIGDLKTGNIEIDPGKMAMQLAIAAHGQWYDPYTHERYEPGVSLERGLILHVPNGEGRAALYVADLEQGWYGVTLANTVRQWRNTGKKLLTEVTL